MEKKQLNERAVVVGQGYVGLPIAMAAHSAGFSVVGIDVDSERIGIIESGESPIADVASDLLREALASGRYRVTHDYALAENFDVAVITVPTPLKDLKPDLSFLEDAAASLAQYLSPGSTVILESTTYPSTTEELLQPILEHGSGLKAGQDFWLGYSPERIDPGNQEWNLTNTPKIVSGVNEISLKKVDSFYAELGIPTVSVSGTREAEMVKLLENTFRHVNIALMNELLIFARALGVNLREAIEAADTKPFGFMKFLPGPGVGGHCLPIDPSYLSWAIEKKAGRNFRFVQLANEVNSFMPEFVVSRSLEILSMNGVQVEEGKIAVLGLAYKKDSADFREAPTLEVVRLLKLRGIDVTVYDSMIPAQLWPETMKTARPHQTARFDLGVLMTDHTKKLHPDPMTNCDWVLDTRGTLSGDNVVAL